MTVEQNFNLEERMNHYGKVVIPETEAKPTLLVNPVNVNSIQYATEGYDFPIEEPVYGINVQKSLATNNGRLKIYIPINTCENITSDITTFKNWFDLQRQEIIGTLYEAYGTLDLKIDYLNIDGDRFRLMDMANAVELMINVKVL